MVPVAAVVVTGTVTLGVGIPWMMSLTNLVRSFGPIAMKVLLPRGKEWLEPWVFSEDPMSSSSSKSIGVMGNGVKLLSLVILVLEVIGDRPLLLLASASLFCLRNSAVPGFSGPLPFLSLIG